MSVKGQLKKDMDGENAEEWEMIDDASSFLNRKRKMESPPSREPEMKKRLGCSYQNDHAEEGNGEARVGYADGDA